MMQIVNWLNNNQGFTMSILTLVYVIATIVIVIYNRKSIQELQKTREQESRPYLFAYLQKDPRDMCFYFRIKNYGKSGGKIENIQVSPQLKFIGEKNVGEFLNNVILAPNHMIQLILLEQAEETRKNTYDVVIKYQPINNSNKSYEEEYTLIMQYTSQMGYTDSKTSSLSESENALKNIANCLDSIRNNI